MGETDLDREIARNFDFFQRTLGEHLRAHAGQFALLKSQRIHGYFESPSAADKAGWSRFTDRIYSIQQVTSEPVELGLYATAND